MGLDWCLVAPPRRTERIVHRERVAERDGVVERMNEIAPDVEGWRRLLRPGRVKELQQLAQRLEELERQIEALLVDPADVAGAPRVGVDARADEWVRENFDALADAAGITRAIIGADGSQAVREGKRPANLEELLASMRGQAVTSLARERDAIPEWLGSDGAGPFAFRGKILNVVGLDEELLGRCYSEMTPGEAAELSDELACASRQLAPSDELKPDEARAAVDGAVRWLRFWSSHGFGVRAWF